MVFRVLGAFIGLVFVEMGVRWQGVFFELYDKVGFCKPLVVRDMRIDSINPYRDKNI